MGGGWCLLLKDILTLATLIHGYCGAVSVGLSNDSFLISDLKIAGDY